MSLMRGDCFSSRLIASGFLRSRRDRFRGSALTVKHTSEGKTVTFESSAITMFRQMEKFLYRHRFDRKGRD